MKILQVLYICLICIIIVYADYQVIMSSSGPTVAGGIVHFNAEILNDGESVEGPLLFIWTDNSLLKNYREHKSSGNVDSWKVKYPQEDCPPGKYIMQVEIKKYFFLVPFHIASERLQFRLTGTFNGEIVLQQYNKSISNHFVSNSTTVLHTARLSAADMDYLNTTATQILTYWFVDCVYYGITNDLKFLMNYTKVDESHVVEAFVIPGFEPFPTEAPITTSTTTTTTPKPTTTKTIRGRRSADDLITNFDSLKTVGIVFKTNSKFKNRTVKYNKSFPFICENHTIVPILQDVPYGFFRNNFTVKDPVKNIVVSGNNWIQRYEVLNLDVNCQGSSDFSYCYYFKYGIYNVTGNETCSGNIIYETPTCNFTIHRYFYDNEKRTAVIVINNDVATNVFPVAITIYKVNKQAQLSVIVVPVSFSLVAIVLIIFGVAFYVQSRPRYFVEVADFDFAQLYDMEYKTFTERLKDSFTYAFSLAETSSTSSEGDPVWHTVDNYESI